MDCWRRTMQLAQSWISQHSIFTQMIVQSHWTLYKAYTRLNLIDRGFRLTLRPYHVHTRRSTAIRVSDLRRSLATTGTNQGLNAWRLNGAAGLCQDPRVTSLEDCTRQLTYSEAVGGRLQVSKQQTDYRMGYFQVNVNELMFYLFVRGHSCNTR